MANARDGQGARGDGQVHEANSRAIMVKHTAGPRGVIFSRGHDFSERFPSIVQEVRA